MAANHDSDLGSTKQTRLKSGYGCNSGVWVAISRCIGGVVVVVRNRA